MESKLNFSLTQLEYILAVHKHGHFAKAAEACFVTQPTLSMQIQKLEETADIVIFDRSKKPILLTDKGRQLMEQMQTVVSEAKRLAELMHQQDDAVLQGELVVGVIPTIAPYLLPRLLPVLEEAYPQLRLRIFELQTKKIIDALNNDEIDAGILATPIKVPRITERALYWEPFHVLCQKAHELSRLKKIKYSALSASDIWLLEEGHCMRHQVLDVCELRHKKKEIPRTYQFESGSLETLKNLVNSYGGYTLIPQLATETLGDNVSLIPFERPIPAREIGMVTRREHYKAELMDALATAIQQCVPDAIKKMKPADLDVLPIE